MAKVGIDWSALQRVLGDLEKRGRSISQFTPVAADILVAAVLDVFEAEGPGWEETERGGTILQDTANLVNSIAPFSDTANAEAFTNVPYAGFHVTGTVHMVERDFTAIDEEATLEEISEALLQDVVPP